MPRPAATRPSSDPSSGPSSGPSSRLVTGALAGSLGGRPPRRLALGLSRPCPAPALSAIVCACIAAPVVAQPAEPAPAPASASTPAPPAAREPAAGAAPSAGETLMPAVRVNASAVRDAGTEGSGAYAAPATTIGKDARPLREIPNSVTVITRQQLDDQNIVTIEDALKQVTGVTVQRYDAAGSYTQFMARGYAADNYQLDGLTLQTDANGIYFDLAAYDRVEVLRGASGIFSGAGDPAVTVNIARKRALATPQLLAGVSVGSWQNYRGELDVTGALDASGAVRGRLVAVLQDYDTFMDQIDGDKKLVYGTLEADLRPDTTLSVGALWQGVHSVLSRGLPTWPGGRLIDMPRSTMPVQDWNRQLLLSKSYFGELEHRLANQGRVKLSLRRVERSNDSRYLDPSVPAADGTMDALSASAFERDDQDNSADLHLSTPFTWGGQTHNLLIGADYRRSGNNTRYAGYDEVPGRINLFDVDPYAIPEPAFDLDTDVSRVRVSSYGTYTQLRIKPAAAWTLVGGARLSWWKSSGVSFGTPTTFKASAELTPYAAVIADLTRSTSLYLGYNEVFKPQNGITATGEALEPRTGRQFELGLKGEARDGRLTWSAAIYRLVDEKRALTDPNDDRFSIASGKARSQGLEAELRGEITPGWSLTAGYAYTATKLLRAAAGQEGTSLSSFTPKHNVNLWTQVRLDALLPGLEAGGGLRAVSRFYNSSGVNRVDGPGYAVAALQAAYRFNDHYRVALNIDNLFDRTYYEKVSYPGRQNFFGEPRSVTLSLRASY